MSVATGGHSRPRPWGGVEVERYDRPLRGADDEAVERLRTMADSESLPDDSGADAPAQLPREVRAGLVRRDPAALGVFFDAYFDRVYGYVRRLVGEEHLAEDLTQDVFLQLYRTFESYDPERDLRPWVFAIATNKVRDFWRSRGHREAQRAESIERDGAAGELPSRAAQPDADLNALEVADLLRSAVDTLPDGLRMTVLLRVYEGLSFQAIGGILDCNEATARKRYSRAIEKLRGVVGGSALLGGEARG